MKLHDRFTQIIMNAKKKHKISSVSPSSGQFVEISSRNQMEMITHGNAKSNAILSGRTFGKPCML